MQTSLMFVDLSSQGFLPDIEKIAIKMPKGQAELDKGAYSGFADLINALMSTVPAEELQQSLDQLEWVPLEEGEVPGFAPLIDLTQEQAKAIGMTRSLLNASADDNPQQTETLKSVLFPAAPSPMPDEQILEPEESIKAPVQNIGDQKSHREVAGHQLKQMHSGIAEPLPDGEQKANHNHEVGTVKSNPEALKVDTQAVKTKTTEEMQNKEMPPVIQPNEGKERETRFEPIEKRSASMTQLQSSKGQSALQGETRQQFTGNPQQEPEQLDKLGVRPSKGEDVPVREFKPGIVDHSVETAKEPSDLLTKGGSETREPMGAMAAKAKPAVGDRMEGMSSAREMGPSTTSQDMQTNVIRQIVQRMTLHSQGNQSTMTIKLKPEFLGQVQMQISTDQQQVVVRMATESMAVKEMVEQGLQYLKTELQQHGLEIDKFDVFVANDNEDTEPGQDWAGFRQALKRRQRDEKNQGRDETEKGETPASDEVGDRPSDNGAGEIDYFA